MEPDSDRLPVLIRSCRVSAAAQFEWVTAVGAQWGLIQPVVLLLVYSYYFYWLALCIMKSYWRCLVANFSNMVAMIINNLAR